MNKLKLNQIILFVMSVIILFSIPIYTICKSNITLKDGEEYLFKVEAYDPYDMFRGKYLNISFKENSVTSKSIEKENKYSRKKYYVTIGKYENGFSYFKSISQEKPKNTKYYFETTGYYNSNENKYIIDTPTRYYMNEKRIEKAESVYNDNIESAYVKVRVKNGKMIIAGVYVNNILIDSID